MGFGGSETNWDSFLYGGMNSKSTVNRAFISDPQVDVLTNQARGTFDREKQRDLYTKVFELEEENVYRLHMATRYWSPLWSSDFDNVSSGLDNWISDIASRGVENIWLKN